MATIGKNNVLTGNTIEAQDILNVIDALDGTSVNTIIIGADLIQGNSSNETDNSTSHAEGNGTHASGEYSHAEGNRTHASGECSHAEGNGTTATGDFSHAAGEACVALGSGSYAGGKNTVASGSYQTVIGSYNIPGDDTSPFIVGNGTKGGNLDAFKVTSSGSIVLPQLIPGVTPSWTGKDGEMVIGKVSSVYHLFLYAGAAWHSCSFA